MAVTVFYEIAIILLFSSFIGCIGLFLRQPLVVSMMIAGILVGPSGFGWVTAFDQVDLLAKLGITLLLFIVGLKLDLSIIRTKGPVAIATGLGQVVFTSIAGYLLCVLLGFSVISSLFIAIALTFSSTVIIVKLLSDKNELESEHGQIAVGFLIVQDIVVVVLMVAVNLFSSGDAKTSMEQIFGLLIAGAGLLVVILGLFMRYIIPKLTKFLSQSVELLVLFSISWAVLWASLFHYFGLSKEIGAFIAGISLASTAQQKIIEDKLSILRDFLLLFFFIDLGSILNFSLLGEQLIPAIILSLFVLIGNPLIVIAIMYKMGYSLRTGFLAGLTVAQISEFSLLFASLGVRNGLVGIEVLSLVTLVGLITIAVSTYLILYSELLYRKLVR